MKLYRLTLFILTCLILSAACNAQSPPQGSSPPPPRPAGEKLPDGWERFQLDGENEDAISVVLPGRPEAFPVARFRVSENSSLPVRMHLLSGDAKLYFSMFVDLPEESERMKPEERRDVFFGCWRAVAEQVRQTLTQKTGGQLEVKQFPQGTQQLQGHERRIQDFTVGAQRGRAQAVFIG